MNIKKLKNLLDQYPEETPIKIWDNATYDCSDIKSVTVEYVIEDDYSMPVITLKITV